MFPQTVTSSEGNPLARQPAFIHARISGPFLNSSHFTREEGQNPTSTQRKNKLLNFF